ncbi:MAG TPA: ABC transporter permease [Gemmatimonadaceae bacterium]|nr:ABC transporter permease [Gemmatimonadaceae bacterium]
MRARWPVAPLFARRALRSTGARMAVGILALFVLCAVAAKQLAPYDPRVQPAADTGKNQPPSRAHPFGTDGASRDVLSRLIYGARVSLGVAGSSVLLAVTVGALVGALAGFAGGWVDAAAMRLVDAVLSVPRLLLLIALVASVGPLSIGGIILLLGLTGWPVTSRIVRAEVRTLREREYVHAARATGVPEWRILAAHVLPGVIPQLIVAATLALASVIPTEASLSYLGLGLRPPTPSWGNMILEGSDDPRTWWLVLFPGLAIVATVLSVNALGDRLREAIDARQYQRR